MVRMSYPVFEALYESADRTKADQRQQQMMAAMFGGGSKAPKGRKPKRGRPKRR
jgi:hypothetical protein